MKLFEGRCWRGQRSAEAPPPPLPLHEEDEDAGVFVLAAVEEEEEMEAAVGAGVAAADDAGAGVGCSGEPGTSSRLVADALVLDSSLVSKLQGRRAQRKAWRKRKIWTTGAVLLIASGAANALLGALSLVWTPFSLFMKERLNMRPGFPAYDWWVVPPDVVVSVYIFNVTNSHRFLEGKDSMLHFQEIGPIVYLEKLKHKNVTFNSNGTLTYTGYRHLEFVSNETNVDLNATLVVPNLSVLGIASYLHEASFFTKIGLSVLLQRLRSKPFSRVSVYNYLWNYRDPLMQMGRNMAPFLVPVSNIGILSMMYSGAADADADVGDEVTVHVGPGSARRFFTMDRYHGRPRFGFWRDARCDAVAGASEGALYPQGIRRNDSLLYFRKTLCRVAPVAYTGDLVRDGIDVYRFELPDNFFDRSDDPRTDCYAGDASEPLVSGLSDLSPCFYNFPLAASSPHFMNGDPTLIDSVRGMNPQREKHGSYVIVEPITGVPMESCARIQSNLVVRKLSGISDKLERFSNLTLPMFWVEIHHRDVPWYVYYLLYFTVNVLPDLQSWISFIMLTCGCGMLIAGLSSVICAQKRNHVHTYKFLDLTPSTTSSISSAS